MTITYLFRSAGTGHSIETLFKNVQREVGTKASVNSVQLPHISRGMRSVWKNLRFVAGQKLSQLVHITGDVHYVALALPRSRTVLTVHDCILLEKNRKHPLRYVLFWLLWYYLPIRRVAILTVISEKTRQELIRYLGRVAEKAVVVPNAYDPAFTYQSRSFCQKQPMLLQIGTAPHKNLPRLIEAIDGFQCKLVIVGPLSDGITIELVARHIAYENYTNLSLTEMVNLYVACDIVTFISTYEGFGMPILEANAVGRPVITSQISPMMEVGGAGACYVDPTSVTAIRQGIQHLCQNETYRLQLIQAGRENAQKYTTTKVAAQYIDLYNTLS